MLENAGDCLGLGYFANHAKIPAAFRAHTQIDTEHPVEPGHDEVTVSGVAPYGHTAALAHLTAMDGGNAGGLQEQSLPCALGANGP